MVLGPPPRWGSVSREGRAYGHLMATEPALEQTLQGPAAWEQEAEREHVHGVGPWRLGLKRLRRNKVAIAFGVLFVLLVLACVAAPLWADQVAETTATENHLSDTITVDGEKVNVVALDGVPIGPQWLKADGKFFLGADPNGRDIMVRLRYGGRNSLSIGIAAALLTTVLSILFGVIAGYFRGWSDLDHPRGPRRGLVLSGGDSRCRAGCGACAGRDQDRPDRDIGRFAPGADPDHRRGVRAVHGQADPRPGAVVTREGVRRGVSRAGSGAPSGSCSPRSCRT